MDYLIQIRKGESTTTEAAKELNIPFRTLRRYVKRSKQKTDRLFYIPDIVEHKPNSVVEADGEDIPFPISWKPQTCVPMFQLPLKSESHPTANTDPPEDFLSDAVEWENFLQGLDF